MVRLLPVLLLLMPTINRLLEAGLFADERPLEVEGTAGSRTCIGLTSKRSSKRIRLREGGPPPPLRVPGGGVGVMDTKGDTRLTASATKGDNSSSGSKEALLLTPPEALLVFTISESPVVQTELAHKLFM